MQVITAIAEMKTFSRQARAAGRSVGLVSTMGALHEGHLSLVRQAKRQCDVVVVSIFVNPLQFGPTEDFAVYPRNTVKDLEILKPLKVDAAFVPETTAMYPERFETFVDPGELGQTLEGASRPGHFRGVVTVVLKLLNIVNPDVAYFGQKDFQQALVIRRLVEELNLDVRLGIGPTVREPDGLALSSRNTYLSAEDRKAALVLHRALRRAEDLAHAGETDPGRLREEIEKVFAMEPRAQLDYIAIVDPSRLAPVERATGGCVALVAARVGPARLIDNLIFGPPGSSPEFLLQLAQTSRPFAATGAKIPGFETETLRLKIEKCRDCAAISSILLPPREFLTKYLKRDYPDLNAVRVVVIGRDSPANPENFLYRSPTGANRFVEELFGLLGVKNFGEFKTRFVLTDSLRCHATSPRIAEKAMAHCAKHLHQELKLFPNLETIVLLGEDSYLQFQRLILGHSDREFRSFNELLSERGWATEQACIPQLGDRTMRLIYCHHPTFGYKRSPSIASELR